MNQKTEVQNKLLGLPLFNGMSSDLLVVNGGSDGNSVPTKVKPVFNILRLGFFGAIAYGVWTYVLPMAFVALGQVIALAITAGIILACVIFAPVANIYLRSLALKAHKAIIQSDPFIILNQYKREVIQAKDQFNKGKADMELLRRKAESSAYDHEVKAKNFSEQIVAVKKRLDRIKTTLSEGIVKYGEAFKSEDSYNELKQEEMKSTSEATRLQAQLAQSNKMVVSYGTRGTVLKKFGFKLTTIATAMDIKILDFDATMDILAEEYKFSNDVKNATDSAKKVMGFGKKWEVDYALETVSNTISYNLSSTIANLSDIEKITSELNLNLDSEESYAKLEALTTSIESGNLFIPSSKSFKNVDRSFTQEEKAASGAFGNLLN